MQMCRFYHLSDFYLHPPKIIRVDKINFLGTHSILNDYLKYYLIYF